MKKIPETQTLKDVIISTKQGASSFYLKEGTEPVKVIRHKAVPASGKLLLDEVDEEHIKKLERTERNLLKTGDILISLRLSFKVALIPEELEGATFTGDFVALTVDREKIHPELLAAYLSQPEITRYMEAQARGAIAKAFSKDALYSIPLRIPDKETQDKLLTLTGKIEEHRKLIEEEAAKLREIEQNILLTTLGGNP